MPLSAMKTSLADSLSPKSLILLPSDPDFQPSLARWSELNHKTPGAIVKVGTEEDVPLLVQYCLKHNIAFRATGGGHGIHSTIGAGGVIIDFSLLRAVVVDRRTMTMRAQAGALMQDALTALAAERCCTSLGGANTVGLVGALLGGGITADQGINGLMIDNLLSCRIVTGHDGSHLTVSGESHPELFWGIRGGGQKLGIVTDVVMRIYDDKVHGREDGMVWTGMFVFSPDKIEEVARYLWENRRDDCFVTMMFAGLPPDLQPSFILTLALYASDSALDGIKSDLSKFTPLHHLTHLVPFSNVNDGVDPFCTKAGRKGWYSCGLQILDPQSLRAAWDSWLEFWSSSDDVKMTVVLAEIYGREAVRKIGDEETAFAHRDVRVWASAIPWYNSAATDPAASIWGKNMRSIFRSAPENSKKSIYPNHGTGEEDLLEFYGTQERLDKLQALKDKWDPRAVYGYGNFKENYKWQP